MRKLSSLFIAICFSTMAMAQCTDLFFSEYVEGTSNNKAFEIYNPTGAAINLNGYRVKMNFGGSALDSFRLNGTIAAGGTFVMVDSAANSTLLTYADTTDGYPSVTSFNGDDALLLINAAGDTIDKIGEVNRNGWTVNGIIDGTTDHTLVRKPRVQAGTNNWNIGQNQWIVFPSNTFSNLGGHTMTACGPIADTTVYQVQNFAYLDEEVGTFNVPLALNLPSTGNTYSVDLVLKSGDAAIVNNFGLQNVTFNGIVTTQVAINVVDDQTPEDADTLVFVLRNPTGNLELDADSIITVIILPSDVFYTIDQVRGANANGEADSVGVKCWLTGVVLSPNFNPSGLNFYINDGTAGINVYSTSGTGNFGYTPTEGDSVIVQGEIGSNNGTARIEFLDTVILVGSGSVPSPTVVTALNEGTEGELVRINGVSVTNTSTGSGGDTYTLSDGTNSYIMYVDNDINYTGNLPSTFDVVGVGSQFDLSSPRTGDYQILPRKVADIITTGVEELNANDVKVYPNPTDGILTIIANQQGLNNVKLFDLTGRVVLEQTVNGDLRQQVNIADLKPGMYLLRASGNGKEFNTRIAKQ